MNVYLTEEYKWVPELQDHILFAGPVIFGKCIGKAKDTLKDWAPNARIVGKFVEEVKCDHLNNQPLPI